jgi:23S rRNA (uracil1939-C5)-methyltransferase
LSYHIGDQLEVKIEKIVPNGLGMAFVENLTVFVPLSAVGDTLAVELRQIKGKTGFAKILKVLSASPDRVEAPCRYFGFCGGCDFQHLGYKAQLDAKIGIIKDSLSRIGRIDYQDEISIIPSKREFGYRLRTQFHANPSNEQIGFFQRQSHDIADIEHCDVLTGGMNSALSSLRGKLFAGELEGGLVHIEAAASGDKFSLHANELIEATGELSMNAAGEEFFFSARSFFQGN